MPLPCVTLRPQPLLHITCMDIWKSRAQCVWTVITLHYHDHHEDCKRGTKLWESSEVLTNCPSRQSPTAFHVHTLKGRWRNTHLRFLDIRTSGSLHEIFDGVESCAVHYSMFSSILSLQSVGTRSSHPHPHSVTARTSSHCRIPWRAKSPHFEDHRNSLTRFKSSHNCLQICCISFTTSSGLECPFPSGWFLFKENSEISTQSSLKSNYWINSGTKSGEWGEWSS